MDKNAYQTMISGLKAAGYRLTPQRRAICRVLADSEEHPSAQMIFEQLRQEDDTLSLATVYNTLDTLSRLGIVTILGEVGDSESIRYDADTRPHVNLACVRCHRIIDIPSQHIEALDQEIQHHTGYALLGARMLYYGVCPECQAQSSAKPG